MTTVSLTNLQSRIVLAAETDMLRGHIATLNLTFATRKGTSL